MDEIERLTETNDMASGAGSSVLIEPAPAKLNLSLRILGRRADGYHELESLVVFADTGERVSLVRGSPRQGDRASTLTVAGPFATAIVGTNLVETAIRRVERITGLIAGDFKLDKLLPVAAGLGGGSADAAAVLRLIGRHLEGAASGLDLEEIARGLGADVPACLASRPAFMCGIGERLFPVSLPALDIVLANACEAVPSDKTRQVFRELAAPVLAGVPAPLRRPDALVRDDVVALMREIGNDLEAPASRVMPTLSRVKSAVAATADCEATVLSGAGPTVIGIYPSAVAAQAAAHSVRVEHPGWWIRACRTGAA